jgi:hypothetical protein
VGYVISDIPKLRISNRAEQPLSLGEIAQDAGFHNYASFEGSDKKRTPSPMKKHLIGHILQTGRFSLENIEYSVSFALSNKVNVNTKIENTKQITDLSRFHLWILKMTTSLIHMIAFRVRSSRFNNENREVIKR